MMEDVAKIARDHTASTCANWQRIPGSRSRGRCQSCGVPWQEFEVDCDYRCGHLWTLPVHALEG